MYTTLHISNDDKRAVMVRSFHPRHKTRSKPVQSVFRNESVYDTKSYRDALQRAFNTAKRQIYFNPDMKYFVTFTYKGKNHTPEDVLYDIKQFVKKEKRLGKNPKYIWIMEYQKRGSIHVHMIANDFITTELNKNNYRSAKYWRHGYTSILTIDDFDDNFRPYLYLFKYMKKSQRIGKSFVHSSRNLSNYKTVKDTDLNLFHWNTKTMEYTSATVQNTNFHYFTNYLQKDDTI